ncbi:MAG: hypothetical protein U0O26_07020, partial [Collinsella sp.]
LKAGTEFKRLKKGHRPAPMPPTWTHILSYKPRFIDLRSVASLSDAERTTEDALRRELLVNWDELFAVKPAG